MRVTRALRRARTGLSLGRWSLAGQVFLLQSLVAVLLAATTMAAFVYQAHRTAIREAYSRSLAVSETFAHAPGTRAAMESRDPGAILQPSAEGTRKAAHVAYVVAFDPDGIRWSHPDPSQIGRHVSGAFAPALSGEPFQETFDSAAFGRSVDTTVAVFDERGAVLGLVSVGITVDSVNDVVSGRLPLLLGLVAAALTLSAGGSALVSRRLRAQTHGLGPVEMTHMYEHHDAVLHAVREGVVIVDADGRLVLVNDEARRLLGLPDEDVTDRPVPDLGMAPGIAEILSSGGAADDEVRLVEDRLVSVNQRQVAGAEGGGSGTVATLRDTTELRALTGRADVAHSRLQLLYDAGVRIGTTLDVERTAEELTAVAVPRFADFATVELLEPDFRGDDPSSTGFGVRRTVSSGISDDHPLLSAGPAARTAGHVGSTGNVTARPYLVADLNAADQWRAQDPERARRMVELGIHSLVSVPLLARGVVLGRADFWRSDQRRFDADDLSFAEELGARAAVAVDNARRYTREHSMAVALQRSLLPRALPEQPALETAYRYLPAKAGVAGDWFDVIPLPGARFALVVGDVVGHGVHAAATMGRLRTAVHNFAALDVPPDELLAHLDELVTRMDADEGAGAEDAAVTGATCLYGVYDQVTGVCTFARAGHPGPVVVAPDGTTAFPEVPVSPPLGLGGNLPFETAELRLADGSLIVMFTDGLVTARDRDIDTGLALLRDALAVPGRSPEETCRTVVETVPAPRPEDDITLLVTRTRLMDPDRVAEWEVPSDPTVVSRIRAEVVRRLEEWGLDDLTHTTALIISELVTNAIRYGSPPVRLRLLHGHTGLVCEVADDSSTAPHLRRAEISDEGGRGLFLVAQFADRWGTRYLPHGKVIWTEQFLSGPATSPGEQDEQFLLDQWGDDGM